MNEKKAFHLRTLTTGREIKALSKKLAEFFRHTIRVTHMIIL